MKEIEKKSGIFVRVSSTLKLFMFISHVSAVLDIFVA